MKNLKFLLFLGVAFVAFTFTACDDKDNDLDEIIKPNLVTINQAGLYPEGIDWIDKKDRFVVSSLTKQQIGTVDDDGNYTVLVSDSAIISAVGVLVDEERNRLLVAISDAGGTPNSSNATTGKMAMLGIYDLDSGERLKLVDLAAVSNSTANFANDIAIDDDGNAYVTNSYAPIIWKVTPAGDASVFLQNDALGAPAGEFGLNGIVFVDDGEDYLIVAKSDENKLLRIPINNPTSFKAVEMEGTLPASPDGLELTSDDDLIVVANASAKILKVETNDKWETATIDKTYDATKGQFPTTVTKREDRVYVLYAYLNKLMGGDLSQSAYQIEKVDF